jgi:hypothetical protein
MWLGNGSLVWVDSTNIVGETKHSIVADDQGGAYLALKVLSYKPCGGYKHGVLAQHIDGAGHPRWRLTGAVVGVDTDTSCLVGYSYQPPGIVLDDAGGIIVSWSLWNPDSTSINTRVQRLDSTGVPQWGANGNELHTMGEEFGSFLVKDGSGGAFIACSGWDDTFVLKVQRIDASGVPLWPSGWMTFRRYAWIGGLTYLPFTAVSDGAGGIFIATPSDQAPSNGTHLVRIDGSGTLLFDVLCDGSATEAFEGNPPSVALDAHGGAYVAWQAGTYLGINTRVQHFSSTGDPLWTPGGVEISAGDGWEQRGPEIARDGHGGALIVWGSTQGLLRAQQVDYAGSILLDEPTIIDSANSVHVMASAGDGNGLIVWSRDAHPEDPDLYAARLADLGLITMPRATWRILSVPNSVPDRGLATLFPTSLSNAFRYLHPAYVHTDSMLRGGGYWVKFPGTIDDAIPSHLDGDPILADTIGLLAGWNMIGSITNPVSVDVLTTDPPGILVSSIFGFHGSYSIADSIIPGQGYWVKSSQAGSMLMSSVAAHSPKSGAPVTLLDGYSILTITDAAGRSQRLYYGGQEVPDREFLTLPPPPPQGGFDARFESDRLAEPGTVGGTREVGIIVRGASYPLQVGWTSAAPVSASLRTAEGALRLGETGTTTLGERGPLSLVIGRTADALVPGIFILEESYPNPFNPSATIRYGLPVAATVSLRVYDVLGHVVARLVEGPQAPGVKEARFDGSALPSGIYFYRMVATPTNGGQPFSDAKKMMLVK